MWQIKFTVDNMCVLSLKWENANLLIGEYTTSVMHCLYSIVIR